jgi:hypothetical protein
VRSTLKRRLLLLSIEITEKINKLVNTVKGIDLEKGLER